MVLKIYYDTVKFQKATNDITFMMSQRKRHRKYIIKITSQKFSIFKPLPSEQNRGCAPVDRYRYCWPIFDFMNIGRYADSNITMIRDAR